MQPLLQVTGDALSLQHWDLLAISQATYNLSLGHA